MDATEHTYRSHQEFAAEGGPAFPFPLGGANAAEPSQSGGVSLLEYFAAHAPPVPEFIRQDYEAMVKQDYIEDGTLAWNDGILQKAAALDARWRWHFAKEMLGRKRHYVPSPRPQGAER